MPVNVDELLELKLLHQRLGLELEGVEKHYRKLLVEAISDTGLSREQRMIYVEWLHGLKLEKDEA